MYRSMAPDKKRPQITLDDVTLSRLEALIEKTAHLDLNAVLRDCLSRGLNSLEAEAYSSENKQLVNQKLKQRQGSMVEALAVLQQLSDDPVYAEAISTLQRGLTD